MPCYTPILSVKKKKYNPGTQEYWFVQDLRAKSQIVEVNETQNLLPDWREAVDQIAAHITHSGWKDSWGWLGIF